MKRYVIITYKHGICELLYELPNLKILENIKKVSQLHRINSTAHSPVPNPPAKIKSPQILTKNLWKTEIPFFPLSPKWTQAPHAPPERKGPLKGDFWGKSTVTPVKLFCIVMLINISKNWLSRSWDKKLQIGPKLSICHKQGFFYKIWFMLLYRHITPSHAKKIKKCLE